MLSFVKDLVPNIMREFDFQSKTLRVDDLIKNEIIPKLEAIIGPISKDCIAQLISNSRLKPAIKDQFLEVGGTYEDGSLFYLYSGIARSCYYGPNVEKPIISRIWKKHEVMFDVNSFLNGENRTEAIQMLEDGEIVSISYSSLKCLFDTYPKMLSLLLYLQAENEKYNKFYQHLLKLSVEERVKLYLNHNPTICSRINKDCIALHLGISRSKFSSAYTQYKQFKELQTG